MTKTRKWWYRTIFAIIYVSALAILSHLVLYKELVHDKLTSTDTIITIKPGTSLLQFANQLQKLGYVKHPRLFAVYGLITGKADKIKAGEYILNADTNLVTLLQTIVTGKVTQYSFTIVEGMTFAQLLQELHQHPKIDAQLKAMPLDEIRTKLEIKQGYLEGLFKPETYCFTAGTTDIDFLRRAYHDMQDHLEQAWASRDQSLILKSLDEVLVLASILEKETAVQHEYGLISGVFQRRLAKSMRLQADPTVVYALGDKYTGKIRKSQLKIDSPYNTYLYRGLPPTPIAIPSLRAIDAALHPESTEYLYFVATGDGKHVFSKNLQEHNKAVNKYRIR